MDFKSAQGAKWNGGALSYVALTYSVGWWLLFSSSSFSVWLLGSIILGHSLIIAAYLIHECAHNSIFKDNSDNAFLGELLGWICGSCYGEYEDIRYKHFRHHVDNDDVVWFDYEEFFSKHPFTYKITRWLESLLIPAHDLIMHFIMMFSSFIIPERSSQRFRNSLILLCRGCIFSIILVASPTALAGYILGYLFMISVLRFMDSLQHDYPYHLTLFDENTQPPNKGDSVWEQEHTFSNVISWKYSWPNWLVLNFGFHNAHHARPTAPWYTLPKLHREEFGEDAKKIIPLLPQLIIYWKYRRYRIFHDAPNLTSVEGKEFLLAAQKGQVTGGNAASFLTAF